jgi:hypothetical protein
VRELKAESKRQKAEKLKGEGGKLKVKCKAKGNPHSYRELKVESEK